MADFNPNLVVGELMNNPLFWVLAIILAFFALGFHFGWFNKIKLHKKFKEEDLNESLMVDLRSRMRVQGKKLKDHKLVQNLNSFGKVRKIAEGKIKFHTRESNVKGNTTEREEDKVKPILKTEEVELVYFTVGGNPWLSWIPYIGKQYDPEYFIINNAHLEFDAQSKIYAVNKDIHIYPYAKIWISDVKTQRYLTELEARRTLEFEAETNINSLKRWTYYGEQQAGSVVTMEKETQLEQDKWSKTRDVGD